MISVLRFICLVSLLFQFEFQPVSAQTSSASFIFPVQPLTVNFIDTVVFQWTSNYAQAFLQLWCQNNGNIGNDVNLGSSFQVNTSGSYNYILSVDASKETSFPVACHAELLPAIGTGGVDTPAGITYFSSPGLKAVTTSLDPNASSSPVTTTSTTSSVSKPTAATTGSTISSSPTSSAGTSSTAAENSRSVTNSPPSASATSIGSSAGSSSGSSSRSVPSTTGTSNTNSTNGGTNNNTGAIVGGVIGGLGLLCLIIFGTLILKKIQRNGTSPRPQRNSRRWSWWRSHQNTEMQTGGLHEIDGSTRISRYEKDGTPIYEKYGSVPIHEKDAGMFRRGTTLVELPAENRI